MVSRFVYYVYRIDILILLYTDIKIKFWSSFVLFQKSAAKPFQAPQGYSSAAPYVGSAAPSSMYLGVPPYGSSLFNGSSIPPYDVPFSGGSAYHYNYGSRLSTGSPYRPLHLSGPTPYSSGSMIGNGMLCSFIPLWWFCFFFSLLGYGYISTLNLFLLIFSHLQCSDIPMLLYPCLCWFHLGF